MEQKGSRFWTGFLLGAAIGAGAGLLLAPSPGSETRARLKDFSSQAKEKATELPTGVQSTVHSAGEKTRGYLGDLRARMSQAVEAGKEAAHTRQEKLHAEVEAVTEPKPSI